MRKNHASDRAIMPKYIIREKKCQGVLVVIERLFNRTKIAQKALDGLWLRNEAIAQNIANVDTPGYKRKTVSFEDQLKKAVDGSSKDLGSAADDIKIKITQDNNALSMRLDGNNVDIDSEMAAMAKNNIQYNTLIQGISAEFKKLRSAITEGRR